MTKNQGRTTIGSALLLGGGAAALGASYWLLSRKSAETVEEIEQALQGAPAAPGSPPSSAGVVKVRLTGYWPFVANLTAEERRMEGGTRDRKGNPLHTLEQHLADPVKHPYVSVAGDDAIWPYGQRVVLSPWPNAVFRVVDTGGHFRGAGKLYRLIGHEPLDVCVDSSKTVVPKTGTTARIVAGDNFAKGAAVATSKMKDQVVAGLVDARTPEDCDALARAIESELGGRSREERVAAAWAMRNKADGEGRTIFNLLAPRGEYGSPARSGGYASTRRAPTEQSRQIAETVLDADASADPTRGSVEFWVPSQQERMRQLGDVHRAAKNSGDEELAKKYERYARFGTPEEVRAMQESDGLRVVRVVGVVELLGRLS